ncbi:MAG: HD domain-containing protein [Bacteroidetes bacterium]|nr:HD domain-containing protein [Bacteroidota bacterium]
MTKQNSNINIHSVENSLKKPIESFFVTVYPTDYLTSHGLEHHRRVWEYAKEIISTSGYKTDIDLQFLRELIVACFFHDIGMAINHGINHGVTSLEKTTEFMKFSMMNPSEFPDALKAIEYHDDKDYSSPLKTNRILEILSIADDLDAFGFTGILRYSDIYLRRGVKTDDLGILIRKNAFRRFENFLRNKNFSDGFIKKHTERFEILDRFFKKYNEEIPDYIFKTLSPSGYCGIIEIQIDCIDSGNEFILSNILENYSNDPVFKWFIGGLQSELLSA